MQLVILGSGQDAGVPQIGCNCENCANARKESKFRRLGPSIALMDKEEDFCYIIDASPDFNIQVDMINKQLEKKSQNKKSIPLDGIFLTHSHFGHIAGLWYLGKECVDTKNINVYCTTKMKKFLENNHPFQHLIKRGNITPISFTIGEKQLLENFSIIAFEVPHRNEFADTVGYRIEAYKSVIYLPDLDNWTDEIIALIKEVDIAIIDATFYTKDELPRISRVPHPPMEETINILRESKTEIYFTHFNHTNKTLKRNSKERKETLEKGFNLVEDGLILDI